MASNRNSSEMTSLTINGLAVRHNPECYLGALDAVLRFNGDNTGSLIHHQLGFCYWPSLHPESDMAIWAYERGEAERMIHQVSNVRIQWKINNGWHDLLTAAAVSLQKEQPLIVFADTFFLPHFPKRKGHTPHAAIIYGFDKKSQRLFLKSATPDDWNMGVDDFRPACQSKAIAGGSPVSWVDIQHPNLQQPIDVQHLLRNAAVNMREQASDSGSISGIGGIKLFVHDAVRQLQQDSSPALEFCLHIGKMVPSIFHQRRRFSTFLSEIFGESDELSQKYSKVATSWEIVANMCFRLTFVQALQLQERVAVRLKSLVVEEEVALRTLEERCGIVQILCTKDS